MVITQKFTDCWKVRKKGTKEIYLVFDTNVIGFSDDKRYVIFKKLGKEHNDMISLLFSEFEELFVIV